MIILIDNYDSFTYNLYQCIETLGFLCRVVRNDSDHWRIKRIKIFINIDECIHFLTDIKNKQIFIIIDLIN